MSTGTNFSPNGRLLTPPEIESQASREQSQVDQSEDWGATLDREAAAIDQERTKANPRYVDHCLAVRNARSRWEAWRDECQSLRGFAMWCRDRAGLYRTPEAIEGYERILAAVQKEIGPAEAKEADAAARLEELQQQGEMLLGMIREGERV